MAARAEFESGNIRSLDAVGDQVAPAALEVIRTQIESQTKLRLGLYVLAAFLTVTAAPLAVFAPADRQLLAAIVAVALVVIAAGCAGYGTFAIKTPLVSASAGSGQTGRGRSAHARRPRAGSSPPMA